MSKEVTISNQEQLFIDLLLENGGKVPQAAADAGYSHPKSYGYVLRRRLAKEIAEATQQWLAFHGPKAAHKIVDMMDSDMPNPVHLNAARDVLDRAGIKPKEEVQQVNVKANIFILPEKRLLDDARVIDHE
jgi:hypothetical protein